MKIEAVSFSEYDGSLVIYKHKKMDFFTYLLIEIIKKGNSKTIKETLLELDITSDLLYLFQNSFYYLIDNKLIINKSSSEDINEVLVNEISFSDFGSYCLNKGCVVERKDSIEKKIIYNPYDNKFVSENKISDSSNVVVFETSFDYLNLINKNVTKIVNESDVSLNYESLKVNPYYFKIETNKFSEELKAVLKDNRVLLNDEKKIDENKGTFLSSNYKAKVSYCLNNNLVNSDFNLVVDPSKEFMVEDNKIYISSLIEDYSKYSFVDIVNKEGYEVSNFLIDEVKCSYFIKERVKDSSDLKKYLIKNKEKFSNVKIIEEVIDLL